MSIFKMNQFIGNNNGGVILAPPAQIVEKIINIDIFSNFSLQKYREVNINA